MSVFISSAYEGRELVRKLQQELERENIRTFSMLDVPLQPDALWSSATEQAIAKADAVIFLLGPETSASSHLQAEWQAVLRNDWDGGKLMIPVLLHGQSPSQLPKFLTSIRPIIATSIDQLVDQTKQVIKNPGERRTAGVLEKNRAEQKSRLENLKTFAEALKSGSDFGAGTVSLP